jgi:hypothetical protein
VREVGLVESITQLTGLLGWERTKTQRVSQIA